MGFRLLGLQRHNDIPKRYLVVYVGENQEKQFGIPISYLSQPSIQDLLSQVEQEFGFDHPMGGLKMTKSLVGKMSSKRSFLTCISHKRED